MSLEYYLSTRKIYQQTVLYIENIVELLSDLNNRYQTVEIDTNIFSYQLNSKDTFLEERRRCLMMIQICSDKIKELCQHEYIEDDIDINPELSQRITYCRICEHSK